MTRLLALLLLLLALPTHAGWGMGTVGTGATAGGGEGLGLTAASPTEMGTVTASAGDWLIVFATTIDSEASTPTISAVSVAGGPTMTAAPTANCSHSLISQGIYIGRVTSTLTDAAISVTADGNQLSGSMAYVVTGSSRTSTADMIGVNTILGSTTAHWVSRTPTVAGSLILWSITIAEAPGDLNAVTGNTILLTTTGRLDGTTGTSAVDVGMTTTNVISSCLSSIIVRP